MADIKSLVKDVVASPLGDVIAAVGQGVAAAQHALDEGSLGAVLDIYAESDDEKLRLLQEIGYRPTFYAIPETTGEVRVALRLGQGASGSGAARAVKPTTSSTIRAVPLRTGLNARFASKLYATPVDAGYQNQFGYTADISAKLTFTIKPVPAPEGADELRLVPALSGRGAEQISETLERLGLSADFRDTGGAEIPSPGDGLKATGQDPLADSILRLGDAVTVTMA